MGAQPIERSVRAGRMMASAASLAPLAFALLFAAPLLAQSTVAPGQTLVQQRAALARATAQAEAARKRSHALESRATLATAAADRARAQLAAVAARIQQSEADMRAGEARLDLIAAQQRVQARRLAERQKPIARLTAALQQLARRSPVLALVEPGPVSDAVHRRILLSQMLPIVTARTRDLRAEIARSAALRRSEEETIAALRETRAGMDGQRKQLAALEQRLRIAARQFRDTAGAEAERALAMGEEARDIGDLMGRIEAAGTVREALLRLPGPTLRPAAPSEAARPMAVATARGGSVPRPPAYRLPVVGDVVTGFGELTSSGLRARGLSIRAAPSALVVSPAAGRVAFAGPFRGYGQIVIIEHGAGWTSLVANLGRLNVRVGDTLEQGDPVGSAPAAGRPLIELELRKDAAPVDIASVLD